MNFDTMLALANPGDEIVYHKGYYCVDEEGRRLPEAKAAWQAHERGDVILYQRRMAPYMLYYCARVIR